MSDIKIFICVTFSCQILFNEINCHRFNVAQRLNTTVFIDILALYNLRICSHININYTKQGTIWKSFIYL